MIIEGWHVRVGLLHVGSAIWPSVRSENWFRGPLGSPKDDNTALAEDACVFRSKVLYDTFKAVVFRVAAIAEKQLFPVRLGMWLDLEVKKPLHVLKRKFLCERSSRRIDVWFLSSSPGSGRFFFDFLVELVSDIDENIGGKLWAVLFREFLAIVPSVTNDFVGEARNPSPDWSLDLIPIIVRGFIVLRAAIRLDISLLIRCSTRRSFGLPPTLFSIGPLDLEPWLQQLPGVLIQGCRDLDGCLESWHKSQNRCRDRGL